MPDSLIVGLMRMGYGHIRMGRSAVTWGERARASVTVHDPLSTHSAASAALRLTERFYSECSRLSAAVGGPAERAWGWITRSGGPSSQAASRALARACRRVMGELPRQTPLVGAHPWNSHLGIECGFRRVVNLVPDAHPQAFCVVPGALNVCQNRDTYDGILRLGIKKEEAEVAGHWVPSELAENADADCRLRLERLRRKAPIRLLFSVGGAGAQGPFLKQLLASLAPRAKEGRLRLIVNAGDHPAMARALEGALADSGLRVTGLSAGDDLESFIAGHPLAGPEPEAEAVLIRAADSVAAVSATDRLMRASDVLVTKPSELAFFPLPKLHIRRVGDHEAPSALYSAKLGDGTTERREPGEAAAQVEQWLAGDGLSSLNEGVRAAAARGVYSGSKVAVERALGRAVS